MAAMQPPKAQPKGKAAAAPPPRPFLIGVQSVEFNNYDQSVQLTAGTQDLQAFEVPPQGFLRGIYILVEASGANV